MTTEIKRNTGCTGPTSTAGKAIASINAVKSGLFARADRLLPGESQEQYTGLVLSLFNDLAPVGTAEESEVWTIVGLLQRRQRCERFEASAIRYAEQLNEAEREAMAKPSDGPVPAIPNDKTIRGLSALPRQAALKKLHGVESHISRQLDRCYNRLEWLQARRLRSGFPKTNYPDSIPRTRVTGE